jgi:hypothetical protein
MDTVKDSIERHKATAEILLKLDKPVFIKDTRDDLYFADILLIGDDTLRIECFGPKQRNGKKFTLYWPLILELKEYEPQGAQQ